MKFLGLLAILFIGLKLTNFIDWSWWFVLMPLYAVPIIALVVIGISLLYKIVENKLK